MRSHAGKCLHSLLRKNEPPFSLTPQKDCLCTALKIDVDQAVVNWADASVTFAMVMQAAGVDEFFDYIVSGIIISVGCLTESVSKHATIALVAWVKGENGTERVARLGEGEFFVVFMLETVILDTTILTLLTVTTMQH